MPLIRGIFYLCVCIVPNSHLFPKQSEVMTSHALRAWWLETAPYAPRKPHALASTPATPKEKTLLAFLIWRGWSFFWKRKGCFFSGFCPPSIRAVWRGEMRTRFCQNYFLVERIWQNLDWISRPQEGSGEECGRVSDWGFSENSPPNFVFRFAKCVAKKFVWLNSFYLVV